MKMRSELVSWLFLSVLGCATKGGGSNPANAGPVANNEQAIITTKEACEKEGKYWHVDKCYEGTKEEVECFLNGKAYVEKKCITLEEECKRQKGILTNGSCLADLHEEKIQSKKLEKQKAATLLSPYKEVESTEFERGVLPKQSRICFVGDTGNGSLAQKKVAKQLENNCDQVRHLGDIVYYVGLKDVNDPKLKARFLDIYKDLKAPMFLTLGNHDYYQDPDLWLNIAKTYPGKYIFPNPYYLDIYAGTNDKGLCFISLDGTPIHDVPDNFHRAPRVQAQFDWLDGLTDKLEKRCSFTFAFLHHPYASVGEKEGLPRDSVDSAFFVQEFYEKRLLPKINFLVAGHDHFMAFYPKMKKKSAKTGEEYAIPQILSGSGGMLQVKHKVSRRQFEIPEKPLHFGKEYRETGFVQMTLLTPSNDPDMEAKFTYFRFDGNKLSEFTLPLKRTP